MIPDGKVFDICAAHCRGGCDLCPLFRACNVIIEQLPGNTPEEKSDLWVAGMNEAAKGVEV